MYYGLCLELLKYFIVNPVYGKKGVKRLRIPCQKCFYIVSSTIFFIYIFSVALAFIVM